MCGWVDGLVGFCVFVCLRVCLCVHEKKIYIYIYMCVCVYVCVCECFLHPSCVSMCSLCVCICLFEFVCVFVPRSENSGLEMGLTMLWLMPFQSEIG